MDYVMSAPVLASCTGAWVRHHEYAAAYRLCPAASVAL